MVAELNLQGKKIFTFQKVRYMVIGLVLVLIAGINSCSQNSQETFKDIYLEWAKATSKGEIEDMYQYVTNKSALRIRDQLSKLDEQKRQQLIDFLKLTAPRNEADIEFGAQIIEDSKGILRIQTISNSSNKFSRVKNPRNYGTIFFVKEDGSWKIDKQYFVDYNDPTPLVFEDPDQPISFFWLPQFHASHTSSPSACDSETTWGSQCYRSWAILNLDPNLCSKIPESSFGGTERSNCFGDLAFLTGNPDLCANTNSLGDCKNRVSYSSFFEKTNFYTIDSDKDGLTDFQESYFNTDLTKADTDGDGVNDAIEVKTDTNPLGEGRLGDHLIK